MPELFQSIHVATLALFVLVVLPNNIPLLTDGVPDTTVVEWSCSDAEWAEDDPYGENVAYSLNELIWRTPFTDDSQLDLVGSYEGTTVYAEAGCEQDVDATDCFHCLTEADVELEESCELSINASMQMMDCGIRYSNQKLDW